MLIYNLVERYVDLPLLMKWEMHGSPHISSSEEPNPPSQQFLHQGQAVKQKANRSTRIYHKIQISYTILAGTLYHQCRKERGSEEGKGMIDGTGVAASGCRKGTLQCSACVRQF